VAGLSRKKKSQAQHVDKLSEHLDALRREADALTQAIDSDAASYDAVMAAFKMPQGNATEIGAREATIQSASKGAADVPMKVAERAVALFERLGQLEAIAAASMKSDLQVARLMAEAGARGAIANVEINLDGITDEKYVAAKRHVVTRLRDKLSATAMA
jgi:formiminotetrahydrofolate cyclodeaminase